jgi:predicted RNA-binding Zn ribbon-like protein
MKIHAPDPANRGHAHAVDLENGFLAERLPTLDSALSWFVNRGVIHTEGADRVRTEAAATATLMETELARVHGVRTALREVAIAITERRAPSPASLDLINRALHARQVIELVAAPDGVSVDHRHVGDPIDDALARLADPLVTELTAGHPERIKICASETCEWLFYDASQTSRRRWCDMATCGNRAKAARHRARERAAVEAGPDALNATRDAGESLPA